MFAGAQDVRFAAAFCLVEAVLRVRVAPPTRCDFVDVVCRVDERREDP